MDVEPNVEHLDKVRRWRYDELRRFFPAMPAEEAERLAVGNDPYLLQKAERLRDDGCPAELAYRILR